MASQNQEADILSKKEMESLRVCVCLIASGAIHGLVKLFHVQAAERVTAP